MRDEAADRSRVVGAVNGVFPASAEHQGGRTHGIAGASARNHIRQRGLVALDFLRRRPRRFQVLAADPGRTGPLLAGSADPDRVAHGLAVAEHVIERPLAGFHYHRAARIRVRKSNDFARLRQLWHGRSKQERGRKGRQRAWQMHEAPHRTAFPGRSRQKALVSLVALVMERFNGTPNTCFIANDWPAWRAALRLPPPLRILNGALPAQTHFAPARYHAIGT